MPRSSLASCGTIYPDKEPPMHRITATLERIRPLDQQLLAQTQTRLDNKTKPLGSLGRLEEFACRLVAITGQEQPDLSRKAIFTFAADHGVTEEGVSLYPREVTAQMVFNFLRGGAGVNVWPAMPGPRCGWLRGWWITTLKTVRPGAPQGCPGHPQLLHRPAMTTDETAAALLSASTGSPCKAEGIGLVGTVKWGSATPPLVGHHRGHRRL